MHVYIIYLAEEPSRWSFPMQQFSWYVCLFLLESLPIAFFAQLSTERFSYYVLYLTCILMVLCCFIWYIFLCSVDDGFPPVTFHFENSLLLKVYPHEYLFQHVSMLDLRFCMYWLLTLDLTARIGGFLFLFSFFIFWNKNGCSSSRPIMYINVLWSNW